MKNVALGVPVDVALGLLKFDELRLSLKIVEQEDAGVLGQAKSGSDLRKHGFLRRLRSLLRFLCRVARLRGADALAVRSFSNFSVAGQSTRELGSSSHSSRSELK